MAFLKKINIICLSLIFSLIFLTLPQTSHANSNYSTTTSLVTLKKVHIDDLLNRLYYIQREKIFMYSEKSIMSNDEVKIGVKIAENILKNEEDNSQIVKAYFILSEIGKPTEKLSNLLEAKKLMDETTSPILKKSILLSLGCEYLYVENDASKGIKYIENALSLAKEKLAFNDIYTTNRVVSEAYLYSGLSKKAQELSIETITSVKEGAQYDKLPDALYNAGLVFSNASLNIEISTEYFLEALGLAQTNNLKELEAECLINIAINHAKQNNYKEAIKYFKLIEKNKNIKTLDSYYINYCYLNLAKIYSTLEDKNNSQKYIKLSEKNIKNLDESKKDDFSTYIILLKSEYYRLDKQSKKALTELSKAKKAYQKSSDFEFENFGINLDIQYGKTYLQLNRFKKSISHFEDALEQAEEQKNFTFILSAYKNLSNVYEKNGNTKKAFEYLEKHNNLEKLLERKSNIEYNNVLIKKLKAEKKETEAKNLQLANYQHYERTKLIVIGSVFAITGLTYIRILNKKIKTLNSKNNEL